MVRLSKLTWSTYKYSLFYDDKNIQQQQISRFYRHYFSFEGIRLSSSRIHTYEAFDLIASRRQIKTRNKSIPIDPMSYEKENQFFNHIDYVDIQTEL